MNKNEKVEFTMEGYQKVLDFIKSLPKDENIPENEREVLLENVIFQIIF